jgi:integrase
MDAKTSGQLIRNLLPGKFAKLAKVIPAGTLEARRLASGGVMLYWRVTIGGASTRHVIGVYDSTASPKSLQPTEKGYSVQAAIRAAELLAQKHHANIDSGGYATIRAAERDAAAKARAAKLEVSRFTLTNLLNDYADHLEALGRVSHREARTILKLHVTDAWPELANLPANQITSEQIADTMRRVTELGKGRTSNKLRSYLRAAYQTARAARSKASIPIKFKSYGVTHNPAADTAPDESQNRSDKNPLSLAELRAYWRAIKSAPEFRGAVLRLHLLSGGQRIEQLVRLRTADIAKASITLHDGKGRPGKAARPYAVPLLPRAAAALQACHPTGEFAISTDEGKTHLAGTTLSAWAVEAAAGISDFKAKRIRSGVETLLAGAGVSQDIRGRLQSHGVSGVQARHYDAYDYMKEKRQALQTLHKLLDQRDTRPTRSNKK